MFKPIEDYSWNFPKTINLAYKNKNFIMLPEIKNRLRSKHIPFECVDVSDYEYAFPEDPCVVVVTPGYMIDPEKPEDEIIFCLYGYEAVELLDKQKDGMFVINGVDYVEASRLNDEEYVRLKQSGAFEEDERIAILVDSNSEVPYDEDNETELFSKDSYNY